MESFTTQAKKNKVCVPALLPGLMDAPVVGLVTRLTKIKDYENKRGSGQVFSFILSDKTGDIRVSVFGKDLNTMLDMCQATETVCVSGGFVKTADPRYNITDNEYEMTVSVDQSGTIMGTYETVSRRARDYKKICDISGSELKMKVDVRGIISAVEKPREVKTGAGKLVSLAKVTLVDQSGSSVPCTFWASSSAQVNNWSVGDVLAIQGSQVQEYAQMISLGCTQAEVQHWPEDSDEVSELTKWYQGATASQQRFETLRATQSAEHENQASRDDEMILQYPERMFAQVGGLRRIRMRFGNKEMTFTRDGHNSIQQIATESTPMAQNTGNVSGQSRMFNRTDDSMMSLEDEN